MTANKWTFTDDEVTEQRKHSIDSFMKAIDKGMAVFQPSSKETEHEERHRECVKLTHDWCMTQTFFSLACAITDIMDAITAQRRKINQYRQLLTVLTGKAKDN